MEIIQLWSVNFVYQVCKLWACPKFGQYLYLSVFILTCPTCRFWEIQALAHCTRNYIFCILLEAKNACFMKKIFFQILLIFVYLFCPENSTINSGKTFITQELFMVETCPILSLNDIFNAFRLVHNITSSFNELILACCVRRRNINSKKKVIETVFIIMIYKILKNCKYIVRHKHNVIISPLFGSGQFDKYSYAITNECLAG